MKYRIRRIIIGLIIPTIAAILICGVFYYKNAHQAYVDEIAAYEGDTSEKLKGIIIRSDNWQEFFILEVKDNAYYFRLKKEYYDKIATERASFANITFSEGLYLTWSSSHGKDFKSMLKADSEDTEQEEIEVEKVSGELYFIK